MSRFGGRRATDFLSIQLRHMGEQNDDLELQLTGTPSEASDLDTKYVEGSEYCPVMLSTIPDSHLDQINNVGSFFTAIDFVSRV